MGEPDFTVGKGDGAPVFRRELRPDPEDIAPTPPSEVQGDARCPTCGVSRQEMRHSHFDGEEMTKCPDDFHDPAHTAKGDEPGRSLPEQLRAMAETVESPLRREAYEQAARMAEEAAPARALREALERIARVSPTDSDAANHRGLVEIAAMARAALAFEGESLEPWFPDDPKQMMAEAREIEGVDGGAKE